ncbi:hypothetical protein OIDMADRAFT_131963 [Oidiodendron maius Zn]|uniref:AAA+ ATPase domain-containing protein n=1 Tax=Oidiodendron maius (strain Zn) TaxID=913774 RepID=A0A0C3GJF6_OIDMZ|nr:hypothetical protein OIDMADRAFT_131963 [Oidiodendron maius Zn]
MLDVKGITNEWSRYPPARSYQAFRNLPVEEEEKRPNNSFKAIDIDIRGIRIHSSYIVQAIRELVLYYPSQKLKTEPITVYKPFAILLHYFHDLKRRRDTYASYTKQDPQDVEAAHDLTLLLNFLQPYYDKTAGPEEERHGRGVVSSNTLWFLYKPGENVYSKINGIWRAFVVQSAYLTSVSEGYYGTPKTYVSAWYIAYKVDKFVRKSRKFIITEFEGERAITSLTLIPAQYLQSAVQANELQTRGQHYCKIMQSLPQHMKYFGEASTGNGIERIYDGEIVVDPESWKIEKSKKTALLRVDDRRPRRRGDSDSSSESDYSSDEIADDDSENEEGHKFGPMAEWSSLKITQGKDPLAVELTTHQMTLLPTRLKGYALKHKLWMLFELHYASYFVRDSQNAAIDNLILPSEDLQLITALCRNHLNTNHQFVDFIGGKGEGMILLLHGPPGTGKTFTVECVAEFTRRPLLTLGVADIGTKEENMETRLSDWFNLALKWRAILLIDEADVFLERRSLSDLARNSLVSGMYSFMEYYNGMLFLTTNRVGHLDDAFLSRIQVAITYKKLDMQSQKRIWHRFFTKIREESKDIGVSWEAQNYVQDEETIKSIDMNGREIRNALQIAIALAKERANRQGREVAEISLDDVKQVVSRRQRFTTYMHRIRNANEFERALASGDRNDTLN